MEINFSCALTTVVLLIAATTHEASAQVDPNDAKVDCSLFSKKADGTWFLREQTTIELGDSKITLPIGDIGPRMLQFGMADLYSVLQNACGEKNTEPAQGPKSERETIR